MLGATLEERGTISQMKQRWNSAKSPLGAFTSVFIGGSTEDAGECISPRLDRQNNS